MPLSSLIVAAEGSAPTMSGAVSDIMSVVSTMMTTITGNGVLMTFFCAGIIPIAIGVVRRLKR